MYLTFSPAKLSALRTRIAYLPPEADHVAVLVAAAKGTHATEAEALAYAAAEGPAVVLSVARHRNAAEDARVACPCVPWAMTDLTARTCTNEPDRKDTTNMIGKMTAKRSLSIVDGALDTLTHEQARLLILAAARAVLSEMGHEPSARQLDVAAAEYTNQHGLDLLGIVRMF